MKKAAILEPFPDFIVDSFLRNKNIDAEYLNSWHLNQDLCPVVHSAEILVTRNQAVIDRDLIAKLGNLQAIVVYGTGTDHVDGDAATEAGVQIISAGHENASATAEHTVGLILALKRRLVAAAEMGPCSEWQRDRLMGSEIAGSTVFLIGCGAIASRVAGLLHGFGGKILFTRESSKLVPPEMQTIGAEYRDLETGLRAADIVSLHLPAVKKPPLLGRKQLALLKKEAVLINTSRGHNIDQEALFLLLDQGRLGGAALDVLVEEPPQQELPERKNLLITPHIGGMTTAALGKMHENIMRKVEELTGR